MRFFISFSCESFSFSRTPSATTVFLLSFFCILILRANSVTASTVSAVFSSQQKNNPQTLTSPECLTPLLFTRKKFIELISAYHCLRSQRCAKYNNFIVYQKRRFSKFSRKHSLSHEEAAELSCYAQSGLFPVPYPKAIFKRKYLNVDWALLNRWKLACRSSALFGMPTLRTEQLLDTTQQSLRNSPQCPKVVKTFFLDEARSKICPLTLQSVPAERYFSVVESYLVEAYARFHICEAPAPKRVGPLIGADHKGECPRLNANELSLTVLDPLGTGAESEVWRVCVSSFHNVESPVPKIVALKLFRRQVSVTAMRKSTGFRNVHRTGTWARLKSSIYDILRFIDITSPEHVLFPKLIVKIKDPQFLSASTEQRIGQYEVLYNGVAAFMDVADKDLRSYFLPWKATVSASNLACIGRHILEVLRQFERAGVVWMDCKPRNILIFGADLAKIGDPGIVRAMGAAVSKPGPGTPGFRPPEAFALPKSDKLIVDTSWSIFGLGVSLYTLVAGKLPWSEKDVMRQFGHQTKNTSDQQLNLAKVSTIRHYRARMAREPALTQHLLQDVLEKTLHYDPGRRIKLNALELHPFWDLCLA